MTTPSALLFSNDIEKIDLVYGPDQRARIATLLNLHPDACTAADLDAGHVDTGAVRVLFSTWGMPSLTSAQLDRLPNLELVCYAAGSVKPFFDPLDARAIAIVNAAAANAIPVAEMTLSHVLLAMKGWHRNTRETDLRRRAYGNHRGPGNHETTVALLGYGQVARALRGFLRAHRLRVLVVDPFCDPQQARADDVSLVSIEEAFAQAHVISNHLPKLPATDKLIGQALLETMPPDATFINTGRGATVNEPELIAHLQARADCTAILDVTDPEPAEPDSPLYTLPNAWVSGHIAGAINNECHRLADCVIDECERWLGGQDLRHRIRAADLAAMA